MPYLILMYLFFVTLTTVSTRFLVILIYLFRRKYRRMTKAAPLRGNFSYKFHW